MVIGSAREYFRTRMSALSYNEWRDGFNFENVPSTLLENTYHIESGEITSTASDHQVHKFEIPITLRVFVKGFTDPIQAIDDAHDTAETILCEVLLPSNRLSDPIKDIVSRSMSIVPLAGSNDNSMMLVMNFTCLTVMRFSI